MAERLTKRERKKNSKRKMDFLTDAYRQTLRLNPRTVG